MAELDDLRIPKATRQGAEEIIGITDVVCAELLDAKYAELARQVVAKLARKRPSPLAGGRRGTWAAAVVYAPSSRRSSCALTSSRKTLPSGS